MKIKYNKELLESMNYFARHTSVQVKDCFEAEDQLYFIVDAGQIGKAVGKGGSTVKELQQKLKKRIKIVEFNSDIKEFAKNLVHPLKVDEIEVKGEEVVLKSADRNVKAKIIGRNAKNLNMLTNVTRRYFDNVVLKVE